MSECRHAGVDIKRQRFLRVAAVAGRSRPERRTRRVALSDAVVLLESVHDGEGAQGRFVVERVPPALRTGTFWVVQINDETCQWSTRNRRRLIIIVELTAHTERAYFPKN